MKRKLNRILYIRNNTSAPLSNKTADFVMHDKKFLIAGNINFNRIFYALTGRVDLLTHNKDINKHYHKWYNKKAKE